MPFSSFIFPAAAYCDFDVDVIDDTSDTFVAADVKVNTTLVDATADVACFNRASPTTSADSTGVCSLVRLVILFWFVYVDNLNMFAIAVLVPNATDKYSAANCVNPDTTAVQIPFSLLSESDKSLIEETPIDKYVNLMFTYLSYSFLSYQSTCAHTTKINLI